MTEQRNRRQEADLTPLEGKAIYRILAEDTCARLRERYGADFAADRVDNLFNPVSARVFVHPAEDPRVRVTVRRSHGDVLLDDYVSARLLTRAEDELVRAMEAAGFRCAANMALPRQDIQESDLTLTLNEFAQKHGVDRILARLAFPVSGIGGGILDVLRAFSRACAFGLAVRGFVLGEDDFSRCALDMETYASLGAAAIERYAPAARFSLVVDKGESSVTQDALRALLEV